MFSSEKYYIVFNETRRGNHKREVSPRLPEKRFVSEGDPSRLPITTTTRRSESWIFTLFYHEADPSGLPRTTTTRIIESLILGDLGTTKGTSDEKEKITKWKFLLAPG